jgi:hypothetical protein
VDEFLRSEPMRQIRGLIVALSLTLLGSVMGTAFAQAPPEPTPTCPTNHEYKVVLKRTYQFSERGGNYRAKKPWPRRVRKLRDIRACQKSNHTGRYPDMRRVLRKRLKEWRFHRYIDRITPYGEWAIPPYIVYKESRYHYAVWNRGGSGASGAYQIMRGTWAANGGLKFASDAAYAPPWAQHIVAHRLYISRGTQPWTETR